MESAAVPSGSTPLEVKVPPSLCPGAAAGDGVATVTRPGLLSAILHCPLTGGHFDTNCEDHCITQGCLLLLMLVWCCVCIVYSALPGTLVYWLSVLDTLFADCIPASPLTTGWIQL